MRELPKTKTIDELRDELIAGGYEGLYCTEELCGCGLDDLVTCGEPIDGEDGILEICTPAYRHTCIGEDCAYPCDSYLPGHESDCYGPSKDGPKRREPESMPTMRELPCTEAFERAAKHPILHVGEESHPERGTIACVTRFAAEEMERELLAVIDEQERMLRLAYFETPHILPGNITPDEDYSLWLADLRERAGAE